MSHAQTSLTPRERELGAIILQYNEVTERLKFSHEQLLTEVTRLREELEHKNRQLERRERLAALGQMAAGLAHEIRNPLGGIQLYASLLERDLAGSPELLGVVTKIRRGVRILDSLVNDVLTFANPNEPQRARVVLGGVIEQVVELIAPKMRQAKVELRVDRAGDPIELWADPRQLHQILFNTLLNGMEAAGSGGWVELSACARQRDGAQAVITIADSGPGIPPEVRERIFNPFFTTKDSGTGLGLAIVHQLVEAHGGSVTVGEHPAGGAIFTIRLPVAEPAEASGGKLATAPQRSGAEFIAAEPGPPPPRGAPRGGGGARGRAPPRRAGAMPWQARLGELRIPSPTCGTPH
jgi:signal transduction histidine kinase